MGNRGPIVATLAVALLATFLVVEPTSAFDAEETFKRGTWLMSLEGGYGWQADIGSDRHTDYGQSGYWEAEVESQQSRGWGGSRGHEQREFDRP